MSTIHCSVSYHRLGPDILDVFSIGVRDGIFNNATVFVTPPMTQPIFQALIDDYINTRGAYKAGGLAQKGPYLDAKSALISNLDTLADYVDSIANGAESIILLAGFVPTKAGSTSVAVPTQPVISKLVRGATTVINVECAAIPDAEYYGCLLVPNSAMASESQTVGFRQVTVILQQNPTPGFGVALITDLSKSRKKSFSGLVPHTVYYVYMYAANASGVSLLSNVESIECL